MKSTDKTPSLGTLKKRPASFNQLELQAIYEYATNLPMSDAESGDPIGFSINEELLDGNDKNDAVEVMRRLDKVVEDVLAFSRVVDSIFYGQLDVEEKLEEVNQILGRLGS